MVLHWQMIDTVSLAISKHAASTNFSQGLSTLPAISYQVLTNFLYKFYGYMRGRKSSVL